MILFRTLTTLACEGDTDQLSHTFGEDVRGLHIRLDKEKHSHVTDVAFGGISNHRTTGVFKRWLAWVLLFPPSEGGTVESRLGASVQRDI